MEKYVVEEMIKERIEKNKKGLFSEKEINIIEDNMSCISKIYLLGLIDNFKTQF